VLTAVVTVVLLRGQTDTEAEQSRSAKVFEEKLQIYKDFLNALCDALKDGVITKEEYMQLQFQFATITMHTELSHTTKISDSVYTIINALHNSDNGIPDNLMEELLKIVEVLRSELYDNVSDMSEKDRSKLLFNFTELQGSFENEIADASDVENGVLEGSNVNTDIETAMANFVEKMKDALQPWAKSVGATVESYTNEREGRTLRIKSSLIGMDDFDFFGWNFRDRREARLAIGQGGIKDKTKRRAIYNKTKHFGYKAVFSTEGCAELFPKSREERHLYPVTINGANYKGALERVIAQDETLIKSYVDMVADIYQKFAILKEDLR